MGFLTNLFALGVLFVVWALWLAGWVKSIGYSLATNLNLTGISGFLLTNINLFIFFGFIVGIVLVFRE